MYGIRVSLKKAESTKNLLKEKGLYDAERLAEKLKNEIIFPVKDIKKAKKLFPKEGFVKKDFKKTKKTGSLKSAVEKKLTDKERKLLKTAYDVVGEIAILEVPKELQKKEKLLAESLLKINPRIKTVVKKSGAHIGEFRIQKVKHLAGRKTKEAMHNENKVSLKLNVEKVYFSSRLSSERKRICEMVKKGEKVLVMFSGCAPYVCVIAKNSPAKEVVGIEINPEGHKYGLENLKLNKIKNVRLYLGDVRKIIPKLKEKFDRILMPLPKSAEEFLEIAFLAAKKGTIIHFYDFVEEKDIPKKSVGKVREACKKSDLNCKILKVVKCGQFGPRKYRVCVDFKIQ
ncbi:class I SAM-dependent methyltransferase family protein [Candidatus Woesearchaeota archaeon]|nr:class I SAM-dependent methyltransferase family protein [Candidatus Woesearchaeota archaeon]